MGEDYYSFIYLLGACQGSPAQNFANSLQSGIISLWDHEDHNQRLRRSYKHADQAWFLAG